MKIAILTEIINKKSGSRAPLEIAKALAKRGHKITVLTYSYLLEEETLKELEKYKIIVEIVNIVRLFAPLEIYKRLKTKDYDVVSFHGTLPFFVGARLAGIPIVTTYYGTQLEAFLDKYFPSKPNFLLKLINQLTNILIILKSRFILSLSNKVIPISKYTQGELKKLYGLKSEFVYLGTHQPSTVNSSDLRLRAEGHQPSNKIINILSVSRIVPYKGFHNLIEIFNKLNTKYLPAQAGPKLKLTIIGSSPNHKYLNYLKSIANKNVKFLINVLDDELIANYKLTDIYATFDRYMFFGMPILEAASFGTPTIAAKFAAAVEVIDHGKTGFVANTDDEFKKYLKTLIDSKTLRVKMGRTAQRFANKFTWEKTARVYEKVYLRFGSK